MLRERLLASTGYDLPLRSRGSLNLVIDSRLGKLGDEGYRLEVKPGTVTISASKPAGVFYGTQTLLQLFPPDVFRKSNISKDWELPCLSIEDSPRFSWRGAHMDVARHFMPKEFVLKFLDLMALHKLNTFHWHLVDDNGWRIQIKRYPLLTEKASQVDFSSMNPKGATRSASQPVGGYYTQDDIREVVQYAADRHITVVPEIELPGHANAIISAYPELGNKVEIAASGGDTKFMGDMDNVFNADEATIQFLKNVFDEVLDLFPSKFIHVGGDEVWKDPWKNNPKAQAKMKALGLKNEDELQSWFIRQFDDYLVSKGRRLIGWDEILEGGLAPNAAVMSWRGIDGGIAAAKAGHDVVMSPTSHAYLDYLQSKETDKEPKGIGGFVPIQKVYQFDPVPPALSAAEAKHILGGQGNLWSEYIPMPKHMEYMAYPRLCAMAEVLWSPKEGRAFDEFAGRLAEDLKRLDVLDVNYRKMRPEPVPAAGWKSGQASEEWSDKSWDVSKQISDAGTYRIVFSFTSGACRLDINSVQLVQADAVLGEDKHFGRTGGDSVGNVYQVKIGTPSPGAPITLRARVRTDGGDDSNGDIYISKIS